MAVVTSVLLWHRTRGLYHKVIEVTKAERAKRGLQVRRPVQMLEWQDLPISAHRLLQSCEAA